MRPFPVNSALAIAFALTPLAAMTLLDRFNRGCGDGLCGFFSGILILGTLAVATLIFVRRAARRQEQPSLLLWFPAAIWVAVLARLML